MKLFILAALCVIFLSCGMLTQADSSKVNALEIRFIYVLVHFKNNTFYSYWSIARRRVREAAFCSCRAAFRCARFAAAKCRHYRWNKEKT